MWLRLPASGLSHPLSRYHWRRVPGRAAAGASRFDTPRDRGLLPQKPIGEELSKMLKGAAKIALKLFTMGMI